MGRSGKFLCQPGGTLKTTGYPVCSGRKEKGVVSGCGETGDYGAGMLVVRLGDRIGHWRWLWPHWHVS